MKVLAQSINSTGRAQVSICVDKKIKSKKVHRLVAEAFIGEPQLGRSMVCHKDGNPLNNTPSNLYWGNALMNGADSVMHGTVQIGERNVNAKLTPDIVRKIRAEKRTSTIAAPEYGICVSTFCRIKSGKSWKHIIPPQA